MTVKDFQVFKVTGRSGPTLKRSIYVVAMDYGGASAMGNTLSKIDSIELIGPVETGKNVCLSYDPEGSSISKVVYD